MIKVIFECSENMNKHKEEREFDNDVTEEEIEEAYKEWVWEEVGDVEALEAAWGNCELEEAEALGKEMLRDETKQLLSVVDETKKCYDCCPREEEFIRYFIDEIPIEKVEELYEFLQGEVPEPISMKKPPHLSEQMAFKIIWFLQERMHILPDHIERCKTCGRLYDTYNEGNELHCDHCRRD